MENGKAYIAASSYLNAAPLCYSFVYGEQADRCNFLSDEAPVRCSELLAEGRADAALIPVIEYQRIPGLRIAPGACVASKGSVRSVLLASRVPITQVRSVALDTSSRTSAALIQIVLGRFYEISASYQTSPPKLEDMLQSNDAALIIGDPAMLIDRSTLHIYDLAEEWRKHTGLPFVFAFWAVRGDSTSWLGRGVPADKQIDFLKAKVEGVAHANELADIYSERLGLPRADLYSYLTDAISYDLDEDSLKGLRLYYELAAKSGLIKEPRDMEFGKLFGFDDSGPKDWLQRGLALLGSLSSGFNLRLLMFRSVIYSIGAEYASAFFATWIDRAQVFSSLHLPNRSNHAILLDRVIGRFVL